MKNAFETLGIPRDLVARAQAAGDTTPLAELARNIYRAYSKMLHPDMPLGDDGAMAELTDAYDTLNHPVGREAAIDLYVGSEQVRSLRVSDDRQRQSGRDTVLRAALLGMLPAVDQLRVLDVRRPTRFIAQLGYDSLDLSHAGSTYYGNVVGEVRPEGLTLEQSIVGDVTKALGDDSLPSTFDHKLVYVKSRGTWKDGYLDTDGARKMYFHDQTTRVGGTLRVVGGARRSDLRRALSAIHGQGFNVSTWLSASTEASFSLQWAQHDHAWWLSALRPQAAIGDYLVVLNTSGEQPTTVLIGPIMDVQPI